MVEQKFGDQVCSTCVAVTDNWLCFQWQLVTLLHHWQQSRQSIVGDDIVTTGNEECCP